ncbi:MAG: YybH family protein [Vicinamibacteria bacterium]
MSAQEISRTLADINRAWLENRPEELGPFFDDDIVMVLPGFSERIEGKDSLVESFVDYCRNARTHDFRETDRLIDVFGNAAVASFSFAMVYEREGKKYRSTGRDLWVFSKKDGRWLAVWRTMLDVAEEAV